MSLKLYEYFEGTNPDNFQDDTYGSVYGLDGICYLAQSFTIGTVGTNQNFNLSEVQLYLSKTGTPAGNLSIDIWSCNQTTGRPEAIISSGTIANSEITSFSWYSCTNFSPLFTFEKDKKYAVSIYTASSTDSNKINWGSATEDYGTSYAYYGTQSLPALEDPIGNAWIKLSTSQIWADESGTSDLNDFSFRVFGYSWGSVLTTYQDILDKAGADCNATAIAPDYCERYSTQAESVLNVLTRSNWSEKVSELSENKKFILSEIVSNLAAIKVINFDTSGIGSLDAQRRIENLSYDAENYIQELQKDEIKTFILA